MKITCDVNKDLLPLYTEDILSDDSRLIVEEHIKTCEACDQELKQMKKELVLPVDKNVKPFKRIKKQIHKKHLLVSISSLLCLLLVLLLGMKGLNSHEKTIAFNDNILVKMEDGDLTAKLMGSEWSKFSLTSIQLNDDETDKNYVFFYLTHTSWDKLVSSSKIYSEVTLVYEDKGASDVEEVYYYTGDYRGISSKTEAEIREIMSESVLLWRKGDQ